MSLNTKMRRYIDNLGLFLKYLRKYLAGYEFPVFLALLLLMTGTALQLPVPLIFRKIIDEVIPSSNYALLILYGLVIIAVILLRETTNYLMRLLTRRIRNLINVKLRLDLLRSYYQLPYEEIISREPGYFVSRIYEEPCEFEETLVDSILFLGKSFLILLFGLIACSFLSLKLTVITLLFIPLFQVVNAVYGRLINTRVKITREKEAELRGDVNEFVRTYLTVKVFRAILRIIRRYREKLEEYLGYLMSQLKVMWGFSFLYNSLSDMIPVVIVVLGAVEIINGHFTIGSLVAFLSLANYMIYPVQNISDEMMEIQKAVALIERMEEIRFKGRGKEGLKIKEVRCIELDSIRFCYGEREILGSFNLKIQKGERLLILGENGTGKTTLLNIIQGVLKPEEGEIIVNGYSLTQLDLDSYLERVSSCFQPPQFIPGSLEENVAPGEENYDREYLYYLLEKFRLKTGGKEIKWGGENFSDGEKQKLQIIRGLLKEADVYIFDEPLSNIDEKTKYAVMEEILKRTDGKILVMTMHGHEEFHCFFDRVIHLSEEKEEVLR